MDYFQGLACHLGQSLYFPDSWLVIIKRLRDGLRQSGWMRSPVTHYLLSVEQNRVMVEEVGAAMVSVLCTFPLLKLGGQQWRTVMCLAFLFEAYRVTDPVGGVFLPQPLSRYYLFIFSSSITSTRANIISREDIYVYFPIPTVLRIFFGTSVLELCSEPTNTIVDRECLAWTNLDF